MYLGFWVSLFSIMKKGELRIMLNKTICECLKERMKHSPNELALEYENIMFSWKELDSISDNAAIVFMRMGITKGSHVGLWSCNSPNLVIDFLALVKLGAIPIIMNTCYKEIELSRILEYADVEFLCYGEGHKDMKYVDLLEKIPLWHPKKEHCIAIDKSKEGKWYGFREEYDDITPSELEKLNIQMKRVQPEDTAAILFTSGTSKMPKGVMLSHYSLVNNSNAITSNMHWTNKDKMCVAVPMYHCFGITASLLAAVHCGCALHMLKQCKTAEIFHKIEEYHCTILNGVPTMFLAMMYNEKRKQFNLHSLQSGIIAGSKISPSEYLKICETFQMAHLQTSYGQTETSPCITISDFEDSIEIKADTSGKKIDNIQLRIFDNNAKQEAECGVIGEIQTKGYHVMQGYYKKQEETKDTFTKDGWLKTGDLGYLDNKGYLHITGRIAEMIIRGGENISPAEIEECIKNYPDIKAVKVIGIKADVLQEEIAACIVPMDGKVINGERLKEYIKEKIAYYKVPKYILMFDNLPYTSNGKIALNELKQIVTDQLSTSCEAKGFETTKER